MTRHIQQFEVLRGFAAFWVFCSHILLIAETPIYPLDAGGKAVDLFVILSGFVITLLINRTGEPYGPYLFRRFMRLYPLFLVALLLGWATSALYQPVIGASHFGAEAADNFAVRDDMLRDHFWAHLLLHLTMLHGVVPDTILPFSALSFSGPLWSISLEWQFYLVAPLMAFALDLRERRRWPMVAGALVLCEVARFAAKAWWEGKVPAFLPMRIDLFALGILCAHGWEWARQARAVALGAAAAGVLVIGKLLGHDILPLLLWSGTYVLAALGDRTRASGAVNRLYTLAPFRWLGERSYGVYVLHMPIVLTLAYYVVLPLGLGRLPTLALLACLFPLVLAAAALCYRTIEQPAIRWAKHIVKGKPVEEVRTGEMARQW